MKKTFIILITCFGFIALNAQQLKVRLSDKSAPLKMFNEVVVIGEIINNTKEPILLFRNSFKPYGGVTKKWMQDKNGVQKELHGFGLDTNSGYRKGNFKSVPPGGSYAISSKRIVLDEAGTYKINFSFAQDASTMNPKWGETSEAKSLGKQITKMDLTESFEFTIEKTEKKAFVAKELDSYKISKTKEYSNVEEASNDPSSVFRFYYKGFAENADPEKDLAVIATLKNLRELKIQFGEHDVAIPMELGMLPLTSLKISARKDKTISFPENFLDSGTLTKLELSSIGPLPDFVQKQTKLSRLTFFSVQMTEIPEWIGGFKELQMLQISDSEITSIPAALNNLPKLNKLVLSSNKIKKVENIFGNDKLTRVDLSKNEISSIDPMIGTAKVFNELDLNYNKLTTLPKEIYDLSTLSTLRLNKNQISKLPDGIGKMPKLYYLYINDNQLEKLPKGISKLPMLKHLHLKRNPNLKKDGEYKAIKKLIKSRKGKMNVG